MEGKVTLYIVILLMINVNIECSPMRLPPWDTPRMHCSSCTILGLTMHNMQFETMQEIPMIGFKEIWLKNYANTACVPITFVFKYSD